jgi:iron complex outermembrane receptor protein
MEIVMKLKKIPLLLLPVFAAPLYADEFVQKFDDMTITAPPATSNLVLEGEKLRTDLGVTIGETLQNQLGVQNQSFGGGVGIPVIRGQAGGRVKVMQNNLGINDVSTISPDHANGVEPINVEKIEVLRGADTLQYGSGIIGGIVNVLDGRIPEKTFDKVLNTAAEQRYNSATNETASALKLEGSKDHFAYHLDGFYRDADNTRIGGFAIDEAAVRQMDPSFASLNEGEIENSRGVIGNTGARSKGGSVGLSWVDGENFFGASINTLDKLYGIPPSGFPEIDHDDHAEEHAEDDHDDHDHDHDHDHADHAEETAGHSGHAHHGNVNVQLNQTRYDFKGQLAKPFAFAEKLNFKFGYNDYKHVELNNGIAGTTFLNEAYESRFTLKHEPLANIDGTIGFQTNHGTFQALGAEADLVPKTQSQNYALFAVEKLPVGTLTYEVGGRAEFQEYEPTNAQSVNYVPLSGSAAIAWDMTKEQQWKLGFMHTQRAPQIQELFSKGFHHATRSYEQGDASLDKELSNNLELSYRMQTSWVEANATLFHNWVSDYIYQQRLAGTQFDEGAGGLVDHCENMGECYPVLNTQQQAATFKGFEAQATFPLIANHYGAVDLTFFGDYTRGEFESGTNVPRMPPLRYGSQLSYEKNDWSSNVRVTRAEAQKNAGENESETPTYVKVDVGTQYKIADFAHTEILLFAKGKNLLNENIRNSVSYLRNFSPEMGRSGEVGIRVSY